MLHFGSDEGVNIVAAYHSAISTVKFHGRSAWNICVIFLRIFLMGTEVMLISLLETSV